MATDTYTTKRDVTDQRVLSGKASKTVLILTPDCPGSAGPFIVQLQFAGQGERRESAKRKPVGRCFQRIRRQIQK
jgi:hypothetical protein